MKKEIPVTKLVDVCDECECTHEDNGINIYTCDICRKCTCGECSGRWIITKNKNVRVCSVCNEKIEDELKDKYLIILEEIEKHHAILNELYIKAQDILSEMQLN